MASKEWVEPKLLLAPATAINPVGTTHTVTATALLDGVPQGGVTVNMAVSGANSATGFCVTDTDGQCLFTYTGTTAGTDTITATGTVFGVVLTATVSKTWQAVLPPNRPPDCTSARPSVSRLWPPNHKIILISIFGITDSDGDPTQVTITKITQDEPVNGLGDGDTSPDGFGVGTAQAQVRAERSGKGNGRVYAIYFDAADGKGGRCAGTVSLGVPHDQGKGSLPVDDGQRYDSTKP
jgi:hypothetical protein